MPPSTGRGRGSTVALVALAGLAAAAGLAVVGSGGASGSRGGPGVGTPGRPLTIVLTAHHSRFTPSSVAVPAGSTVRFVVRNLDPIDHELIVGGPAVHRRHKVGRESHHHGDVPGEVSVPAGTTVSTMWTAPAGVEPRFGEEAGDGAPPPGGPVTFACHLPGHLAYGMAGTVDVTTRS